MMTLMSNSREATNWSELAKASLCLSLLALLLLCAGCGASEDDNTGLANPTRRWAIGPPAA